MRAVRGGLLLLLFSFLFTGIASAQVENQDCLECHGTKDILTMSEEERLELVIPAPGKEEVRKAALTLYLDYDRFRASVHGDLDCVDCHTEIGEIPHPQRMGLVDCGACHDEIMEQYKGSKHAEASERLCFECHNPHYSVPFSQLSRKERIGICLQCHEEGGHEWLPQREIHFRYLECTVCHSPRAEKGLLFHFYAKDEEGRKVPLDYEELKGFAREYGGDVAKAIDFNGNGVVEVFEINRFLARLRKGGIRSPWLEEEVLILRPYHSYTDEVEHIKDCTMCHTSKAPFYSRVILRVPRKGGGWANLPLDKGVLAKIPSIPAKDYFYTTVHGRNGVECIDCHADLTILREKEEFQVKTLGTPVCEHCHEEVMKEYRESLHAKVSKKICFGCHDPHSSVPFSQLDTAQRQAICTKCHPNAERAHDWLPQKALHFKYLECTMCHSPQAERGIVFYLRGVSKGGEEFPLRYRDIAILMDVDKPDVVKAIDRDGNGFLESREILDFLKMLNFLRARRMKGVETINLGVRVLVLKPSHNFTNKWTKAKDCSLCHSSKAEFYSKLFLEIPEDGAIRTIPVDREILVGIHPIPVTSDFYLLGESRISKKDMADFFYIVRKIGYKWLDIIGILFLIGGISFVGLHGFLRVITIGMRRRRKKEEE